MARKFDLSVALFAHGWTNETAENWDHFIDNECRSLSLFLELTRCSTYLYFISYFDLISTVPASLHKNYRC